MEDYDRETACKLNLIKNEFTGDRCTNCGSVEVLLCPVNDSSDNFTDLLEEQRICSECGWNLDMEIFNTV